MNVVVGAPVYRQGAYVIDKFMANQQEIQRAYPFSELVLATNEADLVRDLEHLLRRWELRGRVITYETVKPDYARHRVWNIACGREAIRQYMLSQTEARYYMSMDVDMVYDPAVATSISRRMEESTGRILRQTCHQRLGSPSGTRFPTDLLRLGSGVL